VNVVYPRRTPDAAPLVLVIPVFEDVVDERVITRLERDDA